MIGITSQEKLNRLEPDFLGLAKLSRDINCNGYFVFSLSSENSKILSYGRMFAPAIGINEDPVTGNANGPLGAYLVHNRIIDRINETFSFNSIQGEAIGREGVVEVSVDIKDNKPQLIKIGGEAVTIFKTFIEID